MSQLIHVFIISDSIVILVKGNKNSPETEEVRNIIIIIIIIII